MAGVWWFGLVSVGMLAVVLKTQRGRAFFRLIHRKVFAYFLSRMVKKYNERMSSFKEKLFEDMKTQKSAVARNLRVLEIGVGAGANFKFYPPGTHIIAVDPNQEFDKYLKKNAEDFGDIVLQQFVIAPGENMAAVHDESVDAVVCTLVMCNVTDQVKVISEVKRVLKPRGKLYYLEHVRASPNTWLYSLQNWIDPVWYYVSDGCTFRSEVFKHLDAAGFSQVNYQKFDAPLNMPLVKPHLMGTATK